ncbi:class I SAM-dependent methyltransferase [Psychrobacillus sp. NPDC096426]|uniref:class I SAM-dependent methyltransferase n=1 Tax=Psychrobacillus sp. NPDC096426 TaxID=3364491 RepID=UPI003830978D
MDIKKDVQKQFSRSAELYVNSKRHSKGEDLNKMVEMALPTGIEEVLDIATGGGHMANALATFVRKVTAMDLTPEMLSAAEQFIKGNGHSNVVFVEGDAEKLPFSDNTFDVITCRIAPHHFPNIEDFISESYRVLKHGGQFLLDDNIAPELDEFDEFYNSVEKMRDYSHYRAWKKTEWLQMLELNGFEIQELHRFEKQFEFVSWCERMHLSDIEKGALNEFILKASEKVKNKFRILVNNYQITSFLGESILLKATKP